MPCNCKRFREVFVILAAHIRFLHQEVFSMSKTNADLLVSIAAAKQALADEQARAASTLAARDGTIAAQQTQINDLQTQLAASQTALADASDATSEVADVDGITAGLNGQFPAPTAP